MDGCTTYRLSYWPNESPTQVLLQITLNCLSLNEKYLLLIIVLVFQEDQPWRKKGEYHRPVNTMENCTTYRLSYWPHCEKPRSPFIVQDTENILNAG